ncbi:MAG: IS982 family transposase [Desulfobacterales bacterium]
MKTIDPNQENIQIFTELYYEISEFMKTFGPLLNAHLIGARRQRPFCRMSVCEIMTVLIGFQIIGGQNFKQYYKDIVCQFHRAEFPALVSYSRFTEICPAVAIPMMLFLKFRMEMSLHTMIYVIDSTPLSVCINLRIRHHRVFAETAARGKTSAGWFYGFKLHLVISHIGELMSVYITAGNTDDRKPVRNMVKLLKGKLFGDKGYISAALAKDLAEHGLQLITTLKKNMKKQDIEAADRILLRKRAVIESVNDLLKNYFQVEHSRHRSFFGFAANLFSALIAYTFYPTKPRMRGIDLEKALVTL